MSLRDELQEMVESLPEGVKTVTLDADWLRRELDRQAAEEQTDDHPTAGRYLTTQGAAERLSVEPETVAKWCRSDRFPNAFKTDSAGTNGEWRIPVEDLRGLQEGDSAGKDRVHFERN